MAVDPGTAAVIGAGLNTLGGVLGSRGAAGRAKQQQAAQSQMNREARAWQGAWNERAESLQLNKFLHAVTDARAAGLHPLFALGAGGASMQFVPGQAESGGAAMADSSSNALAEAFKGAGQAVTGWADAKQQKALQRYQIRLMDAQTRRAEADAAWSEWQVANAVASKEGAVTHALQRRPPLEWKPVGSAVPPMHGQKAEHRQEPVMVIPQDPAIFRRRDGSIDTHEFPPGLYDETAQVERIIKDDLHYAGQFWRWLKDKEMKRRAKKPPPGPLPDSWRRFWLNPW